MAYVDQAKKSRIPASLKQVMPKGWKYSLAVRNHSTVVLTITGAPFDILRAMRRSEHREPTLLTYANVNHYHLDMVFEDDCVREVFEKIVAALNTDNHDRSDITTDYFDVGHYVDIKVGRWDKPFQVLRAEVAA